MSSSTKSHLSQRESVGMGHSADRKRGQRQGATSKSVENHQKVSRQLSTCFDSCRAGLKTSKIFTSLCCFGKGGGVKGHQKKCEQFREQTGVSYFKRGSDHGLNFGFPRRGGRSLPFVQMALQTEKNYFRINYAFS